MKARERINYWIAAGAVLLVATIVTIVYSKVSIRTFTVAELLATKPSERVEVVGMVPQASIKFTRKTSKVIFPIGDGILAPPTNRITVAYYGPFPERISRGCKVWVRGVFSPTFSEFAADSLEIQCGVEE